MCFEFYRHLFQKERKTQFIDPKKDLGGEFNTASSCAKISPNPMDKKIVVEIWNLLSVGLNAKILILV